MRCPPMITITHKRAVKTFTLSFFALGARVRSLGWIVFGMFVFTPAAYDPRPFRAHVEKTLAWALRSPAACRPWTTVAVLLVAVAAQATVF